MLNKYKHLDNGVTVIYLEKGKGETTLEAFIDTEDFGIADGFTNEYWRSWNKDTGVYTKHPFNTTPTFLKKLITQTQNKHIYHANGNPYDCRRANLVPAQKGANMKGSFKKDLKEIADNLPPIYESVVPKYVEDDFLIEMYNKLDKHIEEMTDLKRQIRRYLAGE